MATTMLMVAMRQRPASWAATSRLSMPSLVVAKRSARAGPEPRVFASVAPETESDSSIWPCSCVRARWRRSVTSRRMAATFLLTATATGITAHAMRVRCQLSATIATRAPITVVRFAAAEVAELVTTFCTPATSLVRRLVTSPARVRVKKWRSWRWR